MTDTITNAELHQYLTQLRQSTYLPEFELDAQPGQERMCLATAIGYWDDAGGLAEAARKEAELAKEGGHRLARPDLARAVLIRRIQQSLMRLHLVVAAFWGEATRSDKPAVPGDWADFVSMIKDLRRLEDAGCLKCYNLSEWINTLEANLLDIEDFFHQEIKTPGSSSLGELAEFRFSLVGSYAWALEYLARILPHWVAPNLPPEMGLAGLCEQLGILTMVQPPKQVEPLHAS